MHKVCASCNKKKNITDFNKRGIGSKGQQLYRSYCKECHYLDRLGRLSKEERDLYKKSKKEKSLERRKLSKYSRDYKMKQKNTILKTKYGIDYDDYQKLLKSQNGVCYICGCTSDKALCVDHDHRTGKVRKLLCDRCNKTIGLVREDQTILENMKNYIEEHKSETCGFCTVRCNNPWCVTNGTKK